jgi:hypothetical protein
MMLRVLRVAETVPVFLAGYEGTKCAVCQHLARKGKPQHASNCELDASIKVLTPVPRIYKTCKRCKTKQRLRKDGTLQAHGRAMQFGRFHSIYTVVGCEYSGTTRYA